ncbi:unnamed protein product (mitochondrion) [Plasmodiophora brassicae]|uniref:Uncharacterized protein n=2 Tax=Plasmodiophora brassicae TaxID=37360 RepID=A0A3P3YK52_PLABS|nr:unnamed protein product [Plasmodiophora brassicae]
MSGFASAQARIAAFCELLAIRVPIIQAPMLGSSSPAMAAAATNAGGLGSLPCALMDVGAVRARIDEAKQGLRPSRAAAGSFPVNVNFFAHPLPPPDRSRLGRIKRDLRAYFAEMHMQDRFDSLQLPDCTPHIGFDEATLQVVLEEKPSAVSFHFGLPLHVDNVIERLHERGITVLCSATTVDEARWLESRNVDVIIAQGFEAGGHRGTFLPARHQGCPESNIGTLALLPQIARSVHVPVVASGGIVDGPGIVAALLLGASGVQMGTAFLTCPEATIDEPHRDALLKAQVDYMPTTLAHAFSGRPARGFINRYIHETRSLEIPYEDFPLWNYATRPLRAASGRTGSDELLSMWTGQSPTRPHLCNKPTEELIALLVHDVEAVVPKDVLNVVQGYQ